MENIENFVLDTIQLSSLKINKPIKKGEYLISKVRYSKLEKMGKFYIQFPKMKLVSISEQTLTFELANPESKYSKQSFDFFKEIGESIINVVHQNCLEWFGKEIPVETLRESMYSDFVKENNVITIDYSLKTCSVLDKKDNPVVFNELQQGIKCDCIGHIKNITFTKESFYITWEIDTIKMYKKKENKQVKSYEFIEDLTDNYEYSDTEEEDPEILSKPQFY